MNTNNKNDKKCRHHTWTPVLMGYVRDFGPVRVFIEPMSFDVTHGWRCKVYYEGKLDRVMTFPTALEIHGEVYSAYDLTVNYAESYATELAITGPAVEDVVLIHLGIIPPI